MGVEAYFLVPVFQKIILLHKKYLKKSDCLQSGEYYVGQPVDEREVIGAEHNIVEIELAFKDFKMKLKFIVLPEYHKAENCENYKNQEEQALGQSINFNFKQRFFIRVLFVIELLLGFIPNV